MRNFQVIAALALIVSMVGCVPASPQQGGAQHNQVAASTPKRISAAVNGNPVAALKAVQSNNASQAPGVDAIEELVDAGLSHLDGRGNVIPQLAETRDLVHHMTDRVTAMGVFYDVEPTMVGNRLVNVSARIKRSTQAWNAEQWDVRS
jgi:hypothetical protein